MSFQSSSDKISIRTSVGRSAGPKVVCVKSSPHIRLWVNVLQQTSLWRGEGFRCCIFQPTIRSSKMFELKQKCTDVPVLPERLRDECIMSCEVPKSESMARGLRRRSLDRKVQERHTYIRLINRRQGRSLVVSPLALLRLALERAKEESNLGKLVSPTA